MLLLWAILRDLGLPVFARSMGAVLCVLLAGLFLAPASALNQRIYSLRELIQQSDSIMVGRAVAVDVPKMRAALVVDEAIKGQPPYRWMALNVAPGGWGHPPAMIRRLGPGLPVVFFGARVKGRHVVLGYANGTWFQITAPDGKDPDRLPWTFTHIEVFLVRTFQGKTADLEAILREAVTGKREPPAPNPGAGPGMGPEFAQNFKPEKPLPPLPDFIAKAIAEPRAGGVVRTVPVRALSPDEQKWVNETAPRFGRTPEETAQLLAQAKYVIADAQRALEYERDHGRGGNRAWVRSAEEILELKQRSDRLSWLDIRGVLMRAGELFTPVTDPVDLIENLRTKFTWDELDPMFDDDKWGRRKLTEEIEKRMAERSPHPLGPGDRARGVLYAASFDRDGSGDLSMEACGWKPLPNGNWDLARRQSDWDGGEAGSQRPGALHFVAPGSSRNPLSNQPPRAGIPLAAKAGDYSGASLWFATGAGDYSGLDRGRPGALAYYDASWAHVRQGESRSFLIVAQVYTPDHTDEVGEPRAGWFYIRRPSRYIDAGIRLVDAQTRTVSFAPEQALLLKVEPALGRFDRVLLRVDVTTQKPEGKRPSEGRNEVRLTAYADGIGEVARATLDLNRARRGGDAALDTSDEGVLLTPAFGTRRPDQGYVPEFYLAGFRVQQVNDGAVEVVKGEGGERSAVGSRQSAVSGQGSLVSGQGHPTPEAERRTPNAERRTPTSAASPAAAKRVRGPRSVVIAVDTSSSMAPFFEKARTAALEALASVKPGERFALLDCAAGIRVYASDWTAATPDNLAKAKAWIEALRTTSGTNTSGLLERALAYPGVSQVVIVTDGGPPSQGVTDVGQLVQFSREHNSTSARIDAVLVTQAPEDNPATRIARENGGSAQAK